MTKSFKLAQKPYQNTIDLECLFFFIRKTEGHEMADFLDKPDETSMDQQNSEPSSSKKWRMMMGTLLTRYISKTIWTSPNCFGHDQMFW